MTDDQLPYLREVAAEGDDHDRIERWQLRSAIVACDRIIAERDRLAKLCDEQSHELCEAKAEWGDAIAREQLTAEALDVDRKELDRLAAQRDAAYQSYLDLRYNLGSHQHWDHTQQNGNGCEICIQQRAAVSRAANMLESVGLDPWETPKSAKEEKR